MLQMKTSKQKRKKKQEKNMVSEVSKDKKSIKSYAFHAINRLLEYKDLKRDIENLILCHPSFPFSLKKGFFSPQRILLRLRRSMWG